MNVLHFTLTPHFPKPSRLYINRPTAQPPNPAHYLAEREARSFFGAAHKKTSMKKKKRSELTNSHDSSAGLITPQRAGRDEERV